MYSNGRPWKVPLFLTNVHGDNPGVTTWSVKTCTVTVYVPAKLVITARHSWQMILQPLQSPIRSWTSFSGGSVYTSSDGSLPPPAAWKHGWSKHGSGIVPSKHSVPQDLCSPCLNLTNSARTMFTPTMFSRRRLPGCPPAWPPGRPSRGPDDPGSKTPPRTGEVRFRNRGLPRDSLGQPSTLPPVRPPFLQISEAFGGQQLGRPPASWGPA